MASRQYCISYPADDEDIVMCPPNPGTTQKPEYRALDDDDEAAVPPANTETTKKPEYRSLVPEDDDEDEAVVPPVSSRTTSKPECRTLDPEDDDNEDVVTPPVNSTASASEYSVHVFEDDDDEAVVPPVNSTRKKPEYRNTTYQDDDDKALVHTIDTMRISQDDDTKALPGTSVRNDRDCLHYITTNGITLRICQSDLTKAGTEVIVSATNECLMQSVGVGKAIRSVIGPSYSKDLDNHLQENGTLKPTEVMHVTNHRDTQRFKYVILANGPSFAKYNDKEKCYDDLKKTFINAFLHADRTLHAESIAVPLVSSGGNGVPKDRAAESLYNAVIEFDQTQKPGGNLSHIYIVDIDGETNRHIANVFRARLDLATYE